MITEEKRRTEILLRYQDNEPLNLSMVEAECPWLLEGLYDPENCIGWKETLEGAGLSYEKIRIEPLTDVTCLICGHQGAHIRAHLRSVHGTTAADYRKEFRRAETASEMMRSEMLGVRHGRKAHTLLPHWEPAWSPNYALDRIREFHKQGIALNYSNVANNEPGFAAYVRRIWNSWDAGLEAAGFKPANLREAAAPREFTKETLIPALQEKFKERPGQLNIRAGRSAYSKVEIAAAFRLFGKYENALEAAGIPVAQMIPALRDADKCKARTRLRKEAEERLKVRGDYDPVAVKQFLDRHEQVIFDFFATWHNFSRSIRTTHRKLFYSPRHGAFDSQEKVIAALQQRQAIGLSIREADAEVDNPSLRIMAGKHFGSWAKALKAADLKLPPRGYRIRDYKEPEDVLQEFRRRHGDGESLFTNDMLLPNEEGGDRSLMKWSKRFFGNHHEAMRLAGVPDPGVKKSGPAEPIFKYPDATSVKKAIRQRKTNRLGLDSDTMARKLENGGDKTLVLAACREFGGWKKAVEAAGCEIAQRPKVYRRERRVWDKATVIAEIKSRVERGLPLLAKDLGKSRFNGGDRTLYLNATRLFATWHAALAAAGCQQAAKQAKENSRRGRPKKSASSAD